MIQYNREVPGSVGSDESRDKEIILLFHFQTSSRVLYYSVDRTEYFDREFLLRQSKEREAGKRREKGQAQRPGAGLAERQGAQGSGNRQGDGNQEVREASS